MTPLMGSISGQITTSQGAPIAGASVTFSGGVVAFAKTIQTDATGSFSSGQVPVGNYSVTFSAPNHPSSTAQATVSDSTTTTVNSILQ